MQKIICFLSGFFTVFFCGATDTVSLRLSVYNVAQQPVPFATVALYRAPDSALVKVQVTDAAGNVIFEKLGTGNYFFHVSHTGFADTTTSVVSIASGAHVFPPLVLQPAGGELAGVILTARKPFIEVRPGRTVVNVDAGITNAGATAIEALEKMPGVTVDKDGNISLKGKSGVLVLIDGKQTYLHPAQLATMLNGMNASGISQVEIMDQPSAAYDAAGNAGVINIRLKKNQQRGFNGTFTTAYGQGVYPKNNNNLQLNYRSGKWNVFGSYSVNVNTGFTDIHALRTYFNEDGSIASLLEQPSFFKGSGNTHNLRAGVDYTLTTQTTVGITLSGLSLVRNGANTNRAVWMNSQKLTDSLIVTRGRNNSRWQNAGANFNLKHVFTASREVTADVDLIGYRMRGDQFFENTKVFPGSYTEGIRASLPAEIQIVSAKADYVERFKTIRLQSGLKASYINTDNLAAYEIKEGAQWLPDWGRSNNFLYEETIQAAYVNAETKQNRWNIQAGLRFEATQYNAEQVGNPVRKDSSFSRRYNSLFPTVLTSFEVDSNHSFSFNAGRRIDRPAFQKLNPFIFIINKYTVQQGNPYFRPQYTWNMELSYVYKSRFITALGYSVTTDYFSQIFPVDSSGLVIYTEGNLGRLQQLTLSISAQVSPAPWWSLSSQAVGVHKKMEGVVGRVLQASITQVTLNMTNQFRLKKGWSAELSGFYTSRSQHDIQEIVDPAGQLSVGVAKAVLKNKGTVKLAIRDIFYTQWMKGNTFFPNAHEYFKLTRDTRVAQLSFSYRFGAIFKTSKRSEGSAGEEMKRVGNG